MALDWKSTYATMYRDHAAAFPPAALHYLLEVIRKHGLAEKLTTGAESSPALTPEGIITTFKAAVRTDFGPLAPAVLKEWGLCTRNDLGTAILLLGSYRCLLLEPSDTLEAFTGGEFAEKRLLDEGIEK